MISMKKKKSCLIHKTYKKYNKNIYLQYKVVFILNKIMDLQKKL